MRFSLRTLIVLMMLGGPACALGYQEWQAYRERELHRLAMEAEQLAIHEEVAQRKKALKSEKPWRQLQWSGDTKNALNRALAGTATENDLFYLEANGYLGENGRAFRPDGSFAGYVKR